jgi:hypothetical protein
LYSKPSPNAAQRQKKTIRKYTQYQYPCVSGHLESCDGANYGSDCYEYIRSMSRNVYDYSYRCICCTHNPFHPIVLYIDYLHYTPRTLQYVNLSKHSNLTNLFYLIYYFPLTIPTGKLPNTGEQLISTKTKDNKTANNIVFYLTFNAQL